jgi:outer membrane lipoprotein
MLTLTALLAACAGAPALDTAGVDSALTPVMAAADTSARGRLAQWGGVIIATRNLKDSTQLEVLAYPLTGGGAPDQQREALGRFLLLRPGYLETVDFAPGRAVTAVGAIQETRRLRIDDSEQPVPVLNAEQLRLWPRDYGSEPQLHFGIGISIGR